MDKYTKVILTIIAVCLVVNTIKTAPFISTAIASSSDAVDVRVIEMKFNTYSPIPVKIQGKLECN